MTMLVSRDVAKMHLRIDGSDSDTEVDLKVTQASAIVLDYVTDEDVDDWDSDELPGAVQAGVLLVLSDLWEHRAGSDGEDVFLSNAAKSLLTKYRDPTLA